MANATFDGADSYMVYSSNNGTSWSDRRGDKFDDMGFKLQWEYEINLTGPTYCYSGDEDFTDYMNNDDLIKGDDVAVIQTSGD